jgi:rhodanese-related sulfurtransferase
MTLVAAVIVTLVIVAVVFTLRRKSRPDAATAMLTIDELNALLARDAVQVIDVRSPEEFVGEQGHIAGALNVPLGELPTRLAEIDPARARPIALVCRTDRRSASAATLLAAQGYTAARPLRGGMTAWHERGMPTA